MEKLQIKKRNGRHFVSAKKLHEILEIKEDFENWTRVNIQNDSVYLKDIDYFTEHRIVECEVTVSAAKVLVIKELGELNKRIWEVFNCLNELEKD